MVVIFKASIDVVAVKAAKNPIDHERARYSDLDGIPFFNATL